MKFRTKLKMSFGSKSDISTVANVIQSGLVNTLMQRQNGRHSAYGIFKLISLYEDYCILIVFSSKFVPQVSNQQRSCIGSDNGLAPNKRQAIIGTNDGLIYWCIPASLGFEELWEDQL